MEKKLTLGLCTSGSRLLVSVHDGEKYGSARRKIYNQERILFPVIERELARAGGSLGSVRTVCAARGPGRFTGIRIALTLAGTLKALSGARVLTATMFEILALQAFESADFGRWRKDGGSALAVLLHAFKEEYFCQFFSAGARLALPRAEGEPVWLPEPRMRELLAARGQSFYAVADEEEHPGIYGLLPAGARRAPAAISKVLPPSIIRAAAAYGRGIIKPLYLKPAKYELENNISYGKGKKPRGGGKKC